MFFGSHYEIMGIVLIINNIFEINASLLIQFLEEFLIKYKSNAAYFLDTSFSLGAFIDKIGGYSDCEFSSKLLSFEAFESVSFAVGADEDVELVLGDRVIRGRCFCSPANFYGKKIKIVIRNPRKNDNYAVSVGKEQSRIFFFFFLELS